jgi:mannose-6-phosphate isomerase-like protein (cupin superfamily)
MADFDRGPTGEKMSRDAWKHFDISAEIQSQQRSGRPYREFLRVPALSCGIYSLPAGAADLQSPHDEDEVYYVLSGSGRVEVDGAEQRVGPGSILYVEATSEHSFFEIDEDITLLVFFASGGPSVVSDGPVVQEEET